VLSTDDFEALNETINGVGIVIRGHHYLLFGDEGFDGRNLSINYLISLIKSSHRNTSFGEKQNIEYGKIVATNHNVGIRR
jgi:hypothetical protein